LIETARELKRDTALILLDRKDVERAIGRAEPVNLGLIQKAETAGDAEFSVPGEISVDGVTFRLTVDDIDLLEEAEPG
jgi:hypothetical protein